MPKTYLKRNNNKIVIKKKDRKVQCIPEDIKIWQIKKYKRFLVERRQLLAKRINEYLG